jgi:hypothetical protein
VDDERDDDLLVLAYRAVETAQPLRWVTNRTYTGDDDVTQPVTYEWNHGLGDVVQAVLDAGLVLTRLDELFEVEWPALPQMVPVGGGRFALPDRRERLPLMYRLVAERTA